MVKEYNVLVPHKGSVGGFFTYRTVAKTAKEAKREAAEAAGYSRVPKGTRAKVMRVYSNPSWRRSVKHLKKLRKRLGIEDWNAPSESKRAFKAAKKKQNPPKLKRIRKSTGWMSARRVKVIRRRGRVDVLVEKPPRKRRR